MKILVTGGLGTVGHVLVKEFRERDHEVWICDLPHHHSYHYIRCDVGSFWQLRRIFEDHEFDVVYHLAAEFGRWNGEDFYDTLWRSNVIGTKNIIRLQEKGFDRPDRPAPGPSSEPAARREAQQHLVTLSGRCEGEPQGAALRLGRRHAHPSGCKRT